MDPERLETILVAVLAVGFAITGAIKLVFVEAATEAFRGWGYPGGMAYVVGVVELGGAVAVLADRGSLAGASSRFWASATLAVVMVGAVATHVIHGGRPRLAVATILFAAAVTLAYRTRPRRSRPGERG